jgi:hypothetical protein
MNAQNRFAESGTSPTRTKKTVTLDAEFPELSGAMRHTGKGRGSSLRVAFAAAGRNLFKQPKLKCKRFSQFTIAVTVDTIHE